MAAKVWLITGSSTGFGRALAEAVLAKGDRLVATARKPEQLQDLVDRYPEQARAVRLDVTNPHDVLAAVETALQSFGQLDVLVNNAGYGLMGAIEEVSDDAVRQQFETNVFGALEMMRAVLPHFRQRRSGHILNLSSVGGFVSFAGAGIYNATKFALEGISEALAKEVESLGIKVTIVEPGAFRTDFNGRSLDIAEDAIEDYTEVVGGFRQWLREMDGKQPGDPAKAAQAMIAAVESPNPPLRLVLGADALQTIEAKLQTVQTELNAWREVTENTAYEGITIGTIGG